MITNICILNWNKIWKFKNKCASLFPKKTFFLSIFPVRSPLSIFYQEHFVILLPFLTFYFFHLARVNWLDIFLTATMPQVQYLLAVPISTSVVEGRRHSNAVKLLCFALEIQSWLLLVSASKMHSSLTPFVFYFGNITMAPFCVCDSVTVHLSVQRSI